MTYPHPSLKPILERTLGIPLFQEQLLRIAMVAAGFTGGEAEELRRAMGFKRSNTRMKKIELKLYQGLKGNGITGEAAETIIRHISSFASMDFPNRTRPVLPCWLMPVPISKSTTLPLFMRPF